MVWHKKSFEEIIQEKTIYKLDQLEEKKNPRSIFFPYYTIGELDTYYRRGDTPAYTGNFIPVWLYPIFLDKVIMYLPPYRSEDDFLNYCGATLDQVLKLIQADLLVPIVGNNLESYQKNVFGKFIKKLPKDEPLIRAQLFEDALLGGDLEFQRGVYNRAEEYKAKIKEFDERKIEEYKRKRAEDPLIPDLDRLPFFIAERVKWQELFGMKENVKIIENSLSPSASPLVAYRTARTLHYVVVPKIYSRGGFTMMAYKDDLQFTDENGMILAPEFPVGSEEIRTGGAKIIQIPMRDWEVEQAVNLVIDIRKHDREVDEEEKKLTGDINKVMGSLGDTYSFQQKPIEYYKKNTKDLRHAFGSFSDKLLEELKRKGKSREIIRRLSGGITSIPAALRERDIETLVDSAEELVGMADIATSPFKVIFKLLIEALIKAGLVRRNDPKIEEKIVNQMRKLQGIVELWGEKEKMNTPFMLVRYNNPI